MPEWSSRWSRRAWPCRRCSGALWTPDDPPSQGLGLLHLTEQGRSDADRVLASQVLPRCHQEPDVPQAGAQIVSPGAGAAIVTISWMTCRGVLN